MRTFQRKILKLRDRNQIIVSAEFFGTNFFLICVYLARISSFSENSEEKTGKWRTIHHWKFIEIEIGIFVE